MAKFTDNKNQYCKLGYCSVKNSHYAGATIEEHEGIKLCPVCSNTLKENLRPLAKHEEYRLEWWPAYSGRGTRNEENITDEFKEKYPLLAEKVQEAFHKIVSTKCQYGTY